MSKKIIKFLKEHYINEFEIYDNMIRFKINGFEVTIKENKGLYKYFAKNEKTSTSESNIKGINELLKFLEKEIKFIQKYPDVLKDLSSSFQCGDEKNKKEAVVEFMNFLGRQFK